MILRGRHFPHPPRSIERVDLPRKREKWQRTDRPDSRDGLPVGERDVRGRTAELAGAEADSEAV